LCEYNLSRKQANVVSANEDLHPLPVFYFTQLLAIALGLDPEVCKFELNQPDALAFLEEKGLLKGAVA
jgi:heterodisulfide reductase subunit B